MTRTEPFTIASVAKTLTDLKKPPISKQALLLLKRLIVIEPQVRGTGGFSKHNLTMSGDSYGLAAGFSDSENEAVRHHLLGGPWTRLVNEGFLVDTRGSGFFQVSEEGLAANTNVTMHTPIPKAANDIPTAFISYSWDSESHKEWVRTLAEKLRGQGVRVILDQWELGVGGDRTHFMESNIVASEFVIIVCTPTYATKGNRRDGGVGYEAMIITSQLAQRIIARQIYTCFADQGILMIRRFPSGSSRRSALIYAEIPTTRSNMTFFFGRCIEPMKLRPRLAQNRCLRQIEPK